MSNLVLGGGSAAADAYTIDQSLRFDEASSSKLSREQSAGNRKTWTFSCWFKRGNLATSAGADRPGLMGVPEVGGAILGDGFRFVNDTDILQFMIAGGTYSVKTTQAFRDTGAWYHFVCASDTTQSTASSRTTCNSPASPFSTSTELLIACKRSFISAAADSSFITA